MHLKEITHPDMIEENIQKQINLASGEIDHYRMEKKFIHKNGQTIQAILDANLIRDVSGTLSIFLEAWWISQNSNRRKSICSPRKNCLKGSLIQLKMS